MDMELLYENENILEIYCKGGSSECGSRRLMMTNTLNIEHILFGMS
jgi:hypothetical protein